MINPMSVKETQPRWDIFCRIVDNFGDIGICWRLSRQLAHEHGIKVRLFIDDFATASKIILGLDSAKTIQTIHGVEVNSWTIAETAAAPADVVIENFSCGLPDAYVNQLHLQKINTPENTSNHTIWVNLDYLSAELWVNDFHAKPSRHPSLPLTKHFFFPGFTVETGGLIREKNLIKAREEFSNSPALQKAFWQKLDIAESIPAPIKISLFFYPEAQINALFLALADNSQPAEVFLPFNGDITELNSVLNDFKLEIGKVFQSGNLTIHLMPFLSQADYDYLLAACDLNFVRGEDSWIRAIWAGKPFIWQPYIQTEDTHIIKLKAFLEVYTKDSDSKENLGIRTMLYNANLLWSGKTETNTITLENNASQIQLWQELMSHLPDLQTYAIQRADSFIVQQDLASKLVIFSENLMKNKV